MTKLKPKQRDHPLKFAGFHNQSPLLTMIKVMNDELFSDLILSRKTRDFDVFGCPFTKFFARCYICPLIHNILCPLSSPVEIVDSIFLPVEVNNSTIELYLPVDSQYSPPVKFER